MARSAGCARLVYNAGLEQRSFAYRVLGQRVGWASQDRELKELKRAVGLEFLREVHSDVLVQSLRDLDGAFGRFFQGQAGYPKRKRKGRSRDSFRLQQRYVGDHVSIETRRLSRHWGEVKLPKLGWVKLRWDRAPAGDINNATVSRSALGWQVSLCCDTGQAAPAKRTEGPVVGVDAGVARSYTLSTGEVLMVPQPTAGEVQRRLRLERQLARQQKGSGRRERTKRQLARLRAKDQRRRTDAIHKATSQLAQAHAVIVIEGLKIKNMTRSAKGTVEQPGVRVAQKAGLNRSILAQGWHTFRAQLTYKTEAAGSTLVVIPAAYTSQECSTCQHVDDRSRESQAAYRCVACGQEMNADENAARVIRRRGLATAAGSSERSGAGQALTAQGALSDKDGNELRTTPITAAAAA